MTPTPTPETLREWADERFSREGAPFLFAAADAWDITLYEKAVAETLAEGYRQGWELDKKRLEDLRVEREVALGRSALAGEEK